MPNNPGAIPATNPVYGYQGGADDPFQQQNPGYKDTGTFNVASSKTTTARNSTMPNWRTRFTPGGPLKVAILGDSLAQGIGVGGVTSPFSHRLSRMIQGQANMTDGGIGLIPVHYADSAGTGLVTSGAPILIGTGYGIGGTARAITGGAFYTLNTANCTMTLGSKAVQRIDCLYVDTGALGSDLDYQIDGGAVQSLVTAKIGDKLVKIVTIPAGAAPAGFAGNTTHTIKVSGSGFGCVFVGFVVYTATTGASGVQIYNAGIGGSTAVSYAADNTDGAVGLSFMDQINPHVTIISLGTNDTFNPAIRDIELTKIALNKVMFKAIATGSDLILITPPPIVPSWFATFPAYFSMPAVEGMIQGLAKLYNCPSLNLRTCWGASGFGEYQASGLLGDTIIHPNDTGVQDIANRLWRVMNMA